MSSSERFPRKRHMQRSRGVGRVARVAGIVAGGLLLAAAALYFARKPVAAWLLLQYLGRNGVESSVAFEELEWNRAILHVAIGAASAPDLSIEKLTISYRWEGANPHLVSIDLFRPSLRAHFDGRHFSLGSLHRLISLASSGTDQNRSERVRSAKMRANSLSAPSEFPTISAEDASIHVWTPAGSLEIVASGQFSGGTIRKLDAHVEPVVLKGRGIAAELQSVTLSASAPENLQLVVNGAFKSRGAKKNFVLEGAYIQIAAADLRWNISSDSALQIFANLRGNIHADQLADGVISVNALQANLDAAGHVGANGADVIAALDVAGAFAPQSAKALAASLPLFGKDRANQRAIAGALQKVHLYGDKIHIVGSSDHFSVALDDPVKLSGENAAVQLSAPHGPLIDGTSGVWRGAGELEVMGADVPNLKADISSYTWQKTATGSAIGAHLSSQARFSLPSVRNVMVAVDGDLNWRGGRFALSVSRCASLAVKSILTKHKRVLANASLRLCARAPGSPLIVAESERVSIDAVWRSLSALLPSGNARIISPRGLIALTQTDGLTSGSAVIAAMRVSDLAPTERFKPLAASGQIALAADRLQGSFDIVAARRTTLGSIRISGSLERGQADIRTAKLAFQPESLQPSDLSPMLAALRSVKGTAGFTGHVDWTQRGLSSSGMLDLDSVDFAGPAGTMHGLNAQVKLASLMPLRTAPDQQITIVTADWITPLTNLAATFQLTPASLQIGSAAADIAQGKISLDPLNIPLAPQMHTQGKVQIRNIDVGMLLAATNLADKVKLSARISGEVPFQYGSAGLRVVEGHVASVGPGRLSIERSVWAGGEAAGQPNAVRGFAYQALEHLAIDKLSGTVNSEPDNRLQFLLHLEGYHDPVTAAEARVGLIELVQGKAFDKSIPLPKGTKVNLTLDLSLNFAELLRAYSKAWADAMTAKQTPP